jgi:hypothetical protein
MADDRPWYRQPDTFIALAALVVSISAVVVGIYEAALQRAHDRAEVWPHLEVSTFTAPSGALVTLTNSGIGPGIVKAVEVTVDAKPRRNWSEVVGALLGRPVANFSVTTVFGTAIRAGDRVQILGLARDQMPAPFWSAIGRVGVRVCYASVFGEDWELTEAHLGGKSVWSSVARCPDQPPDTDF